MKFNFVKIIITNEDENNAKVKVEFDPPLPSNPDDVEDQPCLSILDLLLDQLSTIDDLEPKVEYLQ